MPVRGARFHKPTQTRTHKHTCTHEHMHKCMQRSAAPAKAPCIPPLPTTTLQGSLAAALQHLYASLKRGMPSAPLAVDLRGATLSGPDCPGAGPLPLPLQQQLARQLARVRPQAALFPSGRDVPAPVRVLWGCDRLMGVRPQQAGAREGGCWFALGVGACRTTAGAGGVCVAVCAQDLGLVALCLAWRLLSCAGLGAGMMCQATSGGTHAIAMRIAWGVWARMGGVCVLGRLGELGPYPPFSHACLCAYAGG